MHEDQICDEMEDSEASECEQSSHNAKAQLQLSVSGEPTIGQAFNEIAMRVLLGKIG